MNEKPSLPLGERSEDAFGNHPAFHNHGMLKRALLNVGREDIDVPGISPRDQNINIIGASSGYLGLDLSNAKTPIQLGDVLSFNLNYASLLAAMTSEYVHKQTLSGGSKSKFSEISGERQ
jgi:predicted amino acid racemase